MKNECSLVEDLSALYIENLVSPDTRAFIDEHIQACPACARLLQDAVEPVISADVLPAVPLKKVRKTLSRSKILAVACAAALVSALAVWVLSFLTARNYFPFEPDLITLSTETEGQLLLSFPSKVAGYDIETHQDEEGTAHYISAWSTPLDQLFPRNSRQQAVLPFEANAKCTLYYTENDTTDCVYLYGSKPDSAGRVVLPRLLFSYYLHLAVLLAVILLALRWIFRRNSKLCAWIHYALLVPVSCILALLCIKGFTLTSYSSERDFMFILITAILLCLAGILGLRLYSETGRRVKD